MGVRLYVILSQLGVLFTTSHQGAKFGIMLGWTSQMRTWKYRDIKFSGCLSTYIYSICMGLMVRSENVKLKCTSASGLDRISTMLLNTHALQQLPLGDHGGRTKNQVNGKPLSMDLSAREK